MSANLNESVMINITPATKSVAVENFGLCLIAGANVQGPLTQRVIPVTTLAGALPYLNGGVNSPEYVKLAGLFSQVNSPAIAKLGWMNLAGSTVVTTVITCSGGTWTAGSITSLLYVNFALAPVTVTTAWVTDEAGTLTAHAAAIQAALRTAIGGDTSSTATEGTHTITITPKTGNTCTVATTIVVGAGNTDTVSSALVATGGTAETYTTGLNAIQLYDDDWYQLLIGSSTNANIELAEAWVLANSSPKLFGYASSDTNIIDKSVASDSTSIAALMAAIPNNKRTVGFYSAMAGRDSSSYQSSAADPTADIAAEFFGLISAKAPGSWNAAYQQPAGSVVADNLTELEGMQSRGYYSQINGIDAFTPAKEINTFEDVGSFDIIRWGRCADGSWVDFVIFQDWLVAALKSAAYGVLVNNDKVPYDIDGESMLRGAMTVVFEQAITAKAVTPFAKNSSGVQTGGYAIGMPDTSAASANDKANRVLNNVTWKCWYSGAVNSLLITGTISL
jgi:hypothetical protein